MGILDDKKDSIISISNMDINNSLSYENIKQNVDGLSGDSRKDDIVVVDANVEAAN